MKRLAFALLSLAMVSPVAAQTRKAAVLADWERGRTNVLAFVDVMPDSLYDFRPTPGVRTYAEQIEHIVLDYLMLVGNGIQGLEEPAVAGDASVYLSDAAALRDYVNRCFDYVVEVLQGMSPEELDAGVNVYGTTMTGWQVFDMAREHGVWTLGQLIPYVRLNEIQPPEYALISTATS